MHNRNERVHEAVSFQNVPFLIGPKVAVALGRVALSPWEQKKGREGLSARLQRSINASVHLRHTLRCSNYCEKLRIKL